MEKYKNCAIIIVSVLVWVLIVSVLSFFHKNISGTFPVGEEPWLKAESQEAFVAALENKVFELVIFLVFDLRRKVLCYEFKLWYRRAAKCGKINYF